MEAILQVNDLNKSYGDHHVVKGISFAVDRGEVFGILGPNGAGKSTTISMLSGITESTGGTIKIGSKTMKPGARDAKALIGLVPQELALYETLSARNNLLFFGRIYGLKGKELHRRVDEVLDLVSLTDRAQEAVAKYSGGMKRRINIAAGLLHKPEILFLDEPTVGVDPQSRNAIFEGIESLNRDGMTIIYTTHYMEEAERLCHRVAIVDEGEIIGLDSPAALINNLGGGIINVGVDVPPGSQIILSLQEHPAVRQIDTKDNNYVIETVDLQNALTGLLEITGNNRLRITYLELLEPNLETVFLHMTGKALRD